MGLQRVMQILVSKIDPGIRRESNLKYLEYTHKNYISTIFFCKKTGENEVLKISLPYFPWTAYILPSYDIKEDVLAMVIILGHSFHEFYHFL